MIKHLIYEIERYFLYRLIFVNVKSKSISKKIIEIKVIIEKFFLCITIDLIFYRMKNEINVKKIINKVFLNIKIYDIIILGE